MELLEPVLAARLAADPADTRYYLAVNLFRQAEAMTPDAAAEMLERQVRHGLTTGGTHILVWALGQARAHTEDGLNATAVEIAALEREAAHLESGRSINWMIREEADEAADLQVRIAHLRAALARREAAVAAMSHRLAA